MGCNTFHPNLSSLAAPSILYRLTRWTISPLWDFALPIFSFHFWSV
jgi:hypothetical protein